MKQSLLLFIIAFILLQFTLACEGNGDPKCSRSTSVRSNCAKSRELLPILKTKSGQNIYFKQHGWLGLITSGTNIIFRLKLDENDLKKLDLDCDKIKRLKIDCRNKEHTDLNYKERDQLKLDCRKMRQHRLGCDEVPYTSRKYGDCMISSKLSPRQKVPTAEDRFEHECAPIWEHDCDRIGARVKGSEIDLEPIEG